MNQNESRCSSCKHGRHKECKGNGCSCKYCHSQSGFTLIELLIVVAIILIIAAIAIPNFLRAKVTAQQSAAGATTKTMSTAVAAFAASFPGVPSTLPTVATLGACNTPPAAPDVTHPCVMDQAWSISPTRNGYTFTLTYVSDSQYEFNADPAASTSSTRHYASDQSGTVYYSDAGVLTNPIPATALVVGN